ncbi:MAG: YciI family protein [Actinomycetota bacterium]|nr:YciI family protein [Actinomycetota bacterium]
MPKYMLLIYGSEAGMANVTPELLKEQYDAYDVYTKDIKARGAWVAGEGLDRTSTATTVRVKDGETVTTDGPFAETKEQLGGFYEIEVGNLDDAIKAAAMVPGAQYGSIEVRPVMEYPEE